MSKKQQKQRLTTIEFLNTHRNWQWHTYLLYSIIWTLINCSELRHCTPFLKESFGYKTSNFPFGLWPEDDLTPVRDALRWIQSSVRYCGKHAHHVTLCKQIWIFTVLTLYFHNQKVIDNRFNLKTDTFECVTSTIKSNLSSPQHYPAIPVSKLHFSYRFMAVAYCYNESNLYISILRNAWRTGFIHPLICDIKLWLSY